MRYSNSDRGYPKGDRGYPKGDRGYSKGDVADIRVRGARLSEGRALCRFFDKMYMTKIFQFDQTNSETK